jgi:hypothetical protein
MRVFAIKQLSSGHYLPHNTKGFSFDEPEPPSDKRHPRFFPSEKAAKQALIAWLRGIFINKYDALTGEYIGLKVEHQPHRIPTDYAVVLFTLTEETLP